ncbi:hypothetical protein [Altererythrobacter sp. MTPC7]|uniref:hypothetical protein n=1 Tax=Altererythrobacter sp. MTPC7 TaxID=3056567 RepID=UPI0036F2CA85
MGNIIAILLGVLVLPIVILGTIPFLGWANWLALPVLVLGIVAGQLSSSGNAGRNFCIVVGIIAAIRLSIGGGII